MNLSYIIMGLLGGILRGLVGYTKYLTAYKKVKFNLLYFSITIGISALVGGISGYLFENIMAGMVMNNFYAFIAGYAGGDFIENAFRIIFKKPTLFKLPEVLEKSLEQVNK